MDFYRRMCLICFGLIFVITDFDAIARITKPFFRHDYQFRRDLEAFYKLHRNPRSWRQAREYCLAEGSELFHPTNENEAQAIARFVSQLLPGASHEIFVGIHGLFSRGEFVTLDGIPISELYENWIKGQPYHNESRNGSCVKMNFDYKFDNVDCNKKLPFVCKKRQSMVTWNNKCNTYDLAYIYYSQVQRCYKLHTPKNWTDAFKTCLLEESNLAVINSRVEAEILVGLIKMNEAVDQNVKSFLHGAVHLGFHSRFGDGKFVTLNGQTLRDAGYEEWGSKQPDNAGGLEECGSMFLNGQLNDVACHLRCAFICEHEPREARRLIHPRSLNEVENISHFMVPNENFNL